jgi:hypothetical protein
MDNNSYPFYGSLSPYIIRDPIETSHFHIRMVKSSRQEKRARAKANRVARERRQIGENPGTKECCAVCERKHTEVRLGRDHVHWSTLFRDWLCDRCNCALGHATDDPGIIQLLIDYLEHPWKPEPAPEKKKKDRKSRHSKPSTRSSR